MTTKRKRVTLPLDIVDAIIAAPLPVKFPLHPCTMCNKLLRWRLASCFECNRSAAQRGRYVTFNAAPHGAGKE